MRISELSTRTGVSVASLKYYLREGLLHAGEPLSPTRAAYDESHVERVQLIRTLVEVGGLRMEAVRDVVTALTHPPSSRHELLGAGHAALSPMARHGSGADASPDTSEATDLARRLGWHVHPDSPAAQQLSAALARAAAAGRELPPERLEKWARALRVVAQDDVDPHLATAEPGDALAWAIVGNVLTDPVVIALRRVAQEAVSAERFL